MNNFLKSILALGITSAIGLSAVQAATYKVIDKGDVDSLKYTYSQQENNISEMAISGTNVYNFPVQYQYLTENDFNAIQALAFSQFGSVHELVDLEDFDALKAGNPTANDLSWAVRYLKNQTASTFYQKVGDIVAMTNLNGTTEEFVVYDVNLPGTSELSRSTVDFISGITNNSWVYGNGSSPYLPVDFTESDGDVVTHWLREFATRGFFSPDNGATIVQVMPPESRYGGESAILDMSDSLFAVGYASVGIDEDKLTFLESSDGGCEDPDVLDDLPLRACIERAATDLYHLRAYKWTLNEEGVVVGENLGLAVTPHADDVRIFSSYAQAVNSSGVTVGFSHGWIDETETTPSTNEPFSLYAVVFKDGKIFDFTEDHGKYFNSKAYDINDAGFAVGHAHTVVNGSSRSKFYYVNTNDDENMSMVLPKDFFTGSASTARAINEKGLIVGEGEVETHNDDGNTPRRRHGFLYDINSETFSDINSFLSCDTNYTIIEARDINDNDEISATAILKVPRRDAKGQLMLNSDGEQLVEDVVRAVKLAPISGEIEDCSEVVDKIERQGAGIGIFSLFSLILMGFSRKYLNRRTK